MSEQKKFCKHCGEQIDYECIICPKCGKQVEKLENPTQSIVINNSAVNNNSVSRGREKNKWVSFLLCLFTICGHKFYEGKILMGLIYILTAGLFFIGWFIDLIVLLGKPNPYYV